MKKNRISVIHKGREDLNSIISRSVKEMSKLSRQVGPGDDVAKDNEDNILQARPWVAEHNHKPA